MLETLSGLADRMQAEDDAKSAEAVPALRDTPKETAQIVDLLLAAGADVKSRDEFGNTPLSMAVELGQVSLMRAFLEHGADPNAPGIDGGKPLNTAVESARIEVVTLLLEAGADPNGKDEWGVTPLKAIDNDLQFARDKMPASWDPKGEHASRMEAIRELIQEAGGKEEWEAINMVSCYPFPGGPTIPDKTGSACYLTGIQWGTNVQSNVYWSSSTNTASPSNAWAWDLSSREVNGGTKTFNLYVWPVRVSR